MSGQSYYLRVDNAREQMRKAWSLCEAFLQHGTEVRVRVEEYRPTRSLEQNAKFHATCEEIAKQRQWAGKWITGEGWKRLLIDAWARHEGKEQGDVVPSLDGRSVVNLGIQSRSLKTKDFADLITFAIAYCDENQIELSQ